MNATSRDKDMQPEHPRQAAREAKAALYREHILAMAEQVFGEQGYQRAKVQEISRRAGLSMGSIYALFPGKQQLFDAIMDKRRLELLMIIREHTERSEAPLTCLEELSRAFIRYFHEHRDFLRMQLQLGAAWAGGAIPPKAHSDTAVAAEIHELQLGIFEEGVASGVFIQEDPAYLETLYSGIDQIHLGHWLSHGGKESVEELTESFLRIMRRTFVCTDN